MTKMDEIFFDSNFKIYKCSSISKLESKQFNNMQLQLLFLKVLTSIFRSTSLPLSLPSANSKYLVTATGKNSIFDASLYDQHDQASSVNWKYIRRNIKILFEQEQSDLVYVSCITVSFPKGVRIRRQKFIFMQRVDAKENNSATSEQTILTEAEANREKRMSANSDFNTVLLVSTSQAKFSSVFLKYCLTSLIRTKPILVLPVVFTNAFFYKFLNLLYNDTDKIEDRGTLNIAFKPTTISNALSEVRIDISGQDLHKYLIADKERSLESVSEPLDLIFQQVLEHTAIDFYGLPISKIRVSECVSFLDSNKVYFFGTPNRFPILRKSLKTGGQTKGPTERIRTSNYNNLQNESSTVFVADILELLL